MTVEERNKLAFLENRVSDLQKDVETLSSIIYAGDLPNYSSLSLLTQNVDTHYKMLLSLQNRVNEMEIEKKTKIRELVWAVLGAIIIGLLNLLKLDLSSVKHWFGF